MGHKDETQRRQRAVKTERAMKKILSCLSSEQQARRSQMDGAEMDTKGVCLEQTPPNCLQSPHTAPSVPLYFYFSASPSHSSDHHWSPALLQSRITASYELPMWLIVTYREPAEGKKKEEMRWTASLDRFSPHIFTKAIMSKCEKTDGDAEHLWLYRASVTSPFLMPASHQYTCVLKQV